MLQLTYSDLSKLNVIQKYKFTKQIMDYKHLHNDTIMIYISVAIIIIFTLIIQIRRIMKKFENFFIYAVNISKKIIRIILMFLNVHIFKNNKKCRKIAMHHYKFVSIRVIYHLLHIIYLRNYYIIQISTILFLILSRNSLKSRKD